MRFFQHFDAHHPLKTEDVEVSKFKITDPVGISMLEAAVRFYYQRPLLGWCGSLWLVDIISAVINKDGSCLRILLSKAIEGLVRLLMAGGHL